MIHQIYPVKDNKIIIQLPENFAMSQAEVIVLPVIETEANSATGEDSSGTILADFLTMDTSHFTVEEKQAYLHISQILQQDRTADSPRIAGLFKGLVQIKDNFDDPLPDEDLFWGTDTDAYGITLTPS
jgi:hypothetical protein